MIKIYVGMALTGAPDEYRKDFHDELKASLRAESGVEVLDFFWVSHGITAGQDKDVYLVDKEHVENADLCIFLLDYPSTGLGGEMERRSINRKPFLAFKHSSSKVSRYTLGLCAHNNVEVNEYLDVGDIMLVFKVWRAENM